LPRRLPGEAVAVAFDGRDDVVVQLREPAVIRVPARSIEIALSDTGRVDLGHAVFHANTGANIACASCHPEGAEDGRVWRFAGLGPRRTQSLRGGVAQTLPLHWDGDMPDVAHIAREVFTGRMGGPALAEADAAALAAFLESIPLLRHAAPADAQAVERGRALFNEARVGCAACHGGPRLTSNLGADVGTGTGRALQVPSLLGLGDRAPFMHTGCADTLAARFSAACGGGDRHGVTAGLDTRQLEDLRLYLESL
jgi:cytochrome c peroxidase